MHPAPFNPTVEHPGGCFTCRHFGERVDVAVWCARPGGEHVRSQAERGCAFWEREPGADDDLPVCSGLGDSRGAQAKVFMTG
jgi:hypothetical protein